MSRIWSCWKIFLFICNTILCQVIIECYEDNHRQLNRSTVIFRMTSLMWRASKLQRKSFSGEIHDSTTRDPLFCEKSDNSLFGTLLSLCRPKAELVSSWRKNSLSFRSARIALKKVTQPDGRGNTRNWERRNVLWSTRSPDTDCSETDSVK